MKHYEHLTSEQRAQIELLRKQGSGPSAIGRQLGRSKSTISRELRRSGALNAQGTYAASQAQQQAAALSQVARRESWRTPQREAEIRACLAQHWSPEQIAGRWLQEGRVASQRLSRQSIYAMIGADRKAGGGLWQMLPRGGRKRRLDRCGTRRGHRLKVSAAQEITARPEAINERAHYGDWEVDLIIGAGQQGVLLVAVERLSRKVKLVALPSKEAAVVRVALVLLLSLELVHSLTYDRGLEWMQHEQIATALGAQSYFCKPYHSWEKGGIENMNGLLRRYLPKREPFPYEEMDHFWLQSVEQAHNDRPRKVLGYRTHAEVSSGLARQAA